MKFLAVTLEGLLFVATVSLAWATISSDGTIDLAFGNLSLDAGAVDAAALQSDGKVVITGPFRKVNGVDCKFMARLNADGSVDQSFHNDSGYGWYYHLLLQPDGKILAWTSYGVDRFNPDGSFDASFDIRNRLLSNGSIVAHDGTIASVFLQSDGKLVIAGDFDSVAGNVGDPTVTRYGLARFYVDGSLDGTFIPQPQYISTEGRAVVGAALQKTGANAGKIIFLWGYAPGVSYGIGRLNNDGSFDSSFQAPPNNGYGWYLSGVLPDSGVFVQSDDRVLLFTKYAPYTADGRNIVRLSANGTLDASFNAEVLNEYHERGTVQSIVQQPDGKLIAVGRFHSLGNAPAHTIVGVEINGARDQTFDAIGAGPVGEDAFAAAIRPSDGKILVVGDFASFGGAIRNSIAWINPDGALDATLAGATVATGGLGEIYALATQSDGKILVGGYFTTVNGLPHANLVRLSPDGTLDDTFAVTLGTLGNVKAIKVQPDGSILIGGIFRAVNGVARARLARLNFDGTLDPSFNENVGAYGAVNAIALDDAGNIFIAGDFQTVSPPNLNRIAKLSPDGTLDANFKPPTPHGIVRAIAESSGTAGVVIGGDFTGVGTATQRHIARLDASTGAIDFGFLSQSSSGFSGTVRALLRAADGKYYVGGSFASCYGVSRSGLVRLNADGVLDGTFQDAAASGTNSLALQDGKVFAAGASDGMTPFIRRFTSNGAIDSLFDPGAGPTISSDGWPHSFRSGLAVQADGKVLLGSGFDQFNGSSRADLVRLIDSELNFTAVSRKAHGESGNFDVVLPNEIECRSGAVNRDYRVVLTFPAAVGFSGAALDSGAGMIAQASGSGTTTATIDLTGVANAQTLSIRLRDVTTTQSTADVTVPLRVLIGDVNGDGSVNSGDALQTRNRSGQPLTPTTFRSDVNVDGTINSGDAIIIRTKSGTGINPNSGKVPFGG